MDDELPRLPIKIFLAGAPRSGTSILLFALKSAFDLPGYGESHVIPAVNQMIHAFYKYMDQFSGLDRSIRMELLLSRVSLDEIKHPLFAFIHELYARAFPFGGWVDKTPSSPGIYSLPLVQEIFPDAKLIVTKRNGIEVVSSHVRKFRASFEDACEAWRSAMTGLHKIRPLCHNLLVTDQFEFQNATDRVASKIAAHVGLPDKSEHLAQFLRSERVEYSSTHDWSRQLRLADVSWSDEQKSYFRTKCGELMDLCGYEM